MKGFIAYLFEHLSVSMKFIFLFVFVTLSGCLQAQTVDEIIERYFGAVGTKESWIGMTSRMDKTETWSVLDMLNHHKLLQKFEKQITYKFSKRKDSVVWDRFVSVKIEPSGDTTTACFNGVNYWIQESGKSAVDFDYYSSRYARFANLGHPDLLLKADKLEFVESRKVDGSLCHVIRVTIDDYESDYYFDARTGYLVLYHKKDNDLQTKLSDYRNIDGFGIPFKEEVTNKYGLVSLNQTLEVKIGIPIKDTYFSKQVSTGRLLK